MNDAPRLSLVIPTYNEERYLPRLLDTVDAARRAYRRGAAATEVIVADNRSTDRTAAIARARGCRVVAVERRVIGAVRNAGARAARGELLCFVDADARLHPDTFEAVERALARADVIGGATGVRLERWSAGLALTYAVFVPLVWATKMDTGVVFCRRADFERVGGYSESMLVAEDVKFLWDLKKLGWRRRQALVRLTSVKAIASTRKFDEHGEWHYFPMFFKGIMAFLVSGKSLNEFAATYWYGRQREPDRRARG